MPLTAVVFDVDGTLAETEETHRKAFNAIFREHGLSWNWGAQLYKELLKVTGGKERMRHFIEAYTPVDGRELSQQEIAAMHVEKTKRFKEMVTSGDMALRPGVAGFIAACREQGVRLAIATTTSRSNVDALLTTTLGPDSLAWFEAIGAGEQAERKKPAPDVYEWVLAKLDLPARHCLAVEDSYNGVQAALAAGLACLVTPSFYTEDEDFGGALEVAPSLEQVSLEGLRARLAAGQGGD